MKKYLIIIVCLFAFAGAKAQDYKVAVGANLGPSMGLSMKYYLDKTQALEGLVTYSLLHDGPMFTFLYEYNIPLVDRLNLYMGGGLNMGALHLGRAHKSYNSEFAFGLAPIIGLEYNPAQVPLSLAFDYKPSINFFTCSMWGEFAFKIRFAF